MISNPKGPTMKRALTAILIAIGAILIYPAFSSATGDDGWSCPAGTTFDYKIEPLDGKTFTVPTPPAGWTVTGVVLKVGGPGGGSHILFTPVTPGQVLSVADQQYDISHAHICKGRTQETTTSTSTTTTQPSTTTTTTTEPEETTSTTTVAPTTTSTSSTSTTSSIPDTSSTSTVPASTTTAPSSTSTSVPSTAPTTTSPTASTTTTQPNSVVSSSSTLPPTTIAPKIPVTGGETETAAWALLVLSLGALALLIARRPA